MGNEQEIASLKDHLRAETRPRKGDRRAHSTCACGEVSYTGTCYDCLIEMLKIEENRVVIETWVETTEHEVCEDIHRRQMLGVEKYGQTVRQNPLKLKQWLQHAYEECLDQAIYLKRAMEVME